MPTLPTSWRSPARRRRSRRSPRRPSRAPIATARPETVSEWLLPPASLASTARARAATSASWGVGVAIPFPAFRRLEGWKTTVVTSPRLASYRAMSACWISRWRDSVPRRLGDTDADGAPAEGGPSEPVERARDREGVPAPAAREQRHELVAACAVDRPLVTDGLPEAPARVAEVLVAGLVPLRVVDLLEPVEVDRHQREAGSTLRTCLDRRGQVVVEGTVIPEPGEAVRSRRYPQEGDLGVAHQPVASEREQREEEGDEDQLGARGDRDHVCTARHAAEPASPTTPCFLSAADTRAPLFQRARRAVSPFRGFPV